MKSYEGTVYIDESNSKLRVEFVWPFKSDYRIMEVGSGNDWVMIGSENRKHAWILGRKSVLENNVRKKLVRELDSYGFDIEKICYIPHRIM